MDLDRRTFLRGVVGAAAAVTLGSCGREGPKPRAFPSTTLQPVPAGQLPPAPRPTLKLAGGIFGFSPAPFSYMPPDYGLMILMYDTLLSLDANGVPHPWLAAAHQPSGDGLSHTFRLRDNARWHDGRPLTADDVVFTFEYFKAKKAEGKVAPWVLFKPEYVERVRLVDTHTVEVQLTKPAVTFAREVGSRFPITPRHVWSSMSDPQTVGIAQKQLLVGSGPYRLERAGPGQEGVQLAANDDFFLGKPFVKRLEYVRYGDQLSALRAGRIAAGGFDARATTAKSLESFRDDPSFGVLTGPPDFVVGLYWGVGKGGALADVRFRRACAHAIDRRDMVERLVGGNGVPGNPGFLVPGHPFHVPVEQYRYDPGLARRLLEEAGYTKAGKGRRGRDGKPLRYTVTAPTEIASAVEFVVSSLAEVGVALEVNPQESTGAFSLSDYEMAMLFYGGMQEDPDYLRRVYSSGVDKLFMAADGGYVNGEVDELAERQLVAQDPAARKEMVAQIQRLVAADLPLLHLYYPNDFFVFRKAEFDQWALTGQGGGLSKEAFVTGVGTGGTEIRPIL